MTDTEIAALKEARRILSEHFDAHIVVVHLDNDDLTQERSIAGWSGGTALALGLAHYAVDNIRSKIFGFGSSEGEDA